MNSVLVLRVICALMLMVFLGSVMGFEKAKDEMPVTAELGIGKDSAFVKTKEQYKRALQQADTLQATKAAFKLADLFYKSGNFEYALRYNLAALRLSGLIKNQSLQAAAYSRLGSVYMYVDDEAKSLQSLEAALELFVAINDSMGLAETWGRMGHFWEKSKNYDTAFELQQKALAYFASKKDSVAAAHILENIGSIYEDQMQLDSAAYYFNKGLGHLTGKDQDFLESTLLNNLGDIERKRGNFKKGIALTRQSLVIADRLNNAYLQKSAFRDLSKAFVAQGRHDSAFYYLNYAYEAQSKMFSQESAEQMSQMKALFEIEQKEAGLNLQRAEIKLLESQKRFDKRLQRGLVVGILILITASVWIIRLQKIRRKHDRVIYEQSASISETKRKLAEKDLEHAMLVENHLRAELENKQLQEAILKKRLEERSTELTALTIKIVRKNKLIEEIRGKMKTNGAGKEFKDITRLLDQHLRVDKNWEHFLELFETVHQGFYEKLLAQGTELSPSELRLCCLIRLNIPSKDIASMLGISSDSLRIARYRVHKKLGLKSGERLSAFVLGL